MKAVAISLSALGDTEPLFTVSATVASGLLGLLYVVFAVVQTWPLVTRLPNVIPNDLGDPLLNAC
mgnify:CR=1 FL=1